MSARPIGALLAVLVVANVPSVARAADACRNSCAALVAACRQIDCPDADGGAPKRECVARCRARSGCGPDFRTIAYVVNFCRSRGSRQVGWQELRIQRGGCDPVTALRFESPGDVSDPAGLCKLVAENREGFGSALAGVFQRLGVMHDGSGVVFEVTNAFQLIGRTQLTDDQQGFFYVRRDGSGLRRLGPPSRDPTFRISVSPTGRAGASFHTPLSVSPRGRTIAYSDLGLAPDGQEASQVFTLDVRTGTRTQVTTLPRYREYLPDDRAVARVQFIDDETIQFDTPALAGEVRTYTIGADGQGLRRVPGLVPIPQSIGAEPIVPSFGLTGRSRRLVSLAMVGQPANDDPFDPGRPIVEVFRVEGARVLQLTNFGRYDTAALHGARTGPRQKGWRALFRASADPLGTNPFGNCQLFSLDALGGRLRQLTHFDTGARSVAGCSIGTRPGCSFGPVGQPNDPNIVVFYSDCDPLGTNPDGSQIFVMRADGSALTQITRTTGVRHLADGEVEVEIPGPMGLP